MHGKDVFKSKTFVFGFLGVNLVDVGKSILSTKLADRTKQNWLVKNSQEESNIASNFDGLPFFKQWEFRDIMYLFLKV